jgi:hypothetical protein
MQAVIRQAARAAALLLIAPFLTFASALAPQHVHETGPGHDHPIAHSHFAPHPTDIADIHGAGDTEIEHDVQHVVWLDSPILHESPYRTRPLALTLPVTDDVIPADLTWAVTPSNDAAPVHGPPKDTPRFRGPPPSLV